MISCVAIDDDPLFLSLIESYCEQLGGIDIMGTYVNPVTGALAIARYEPDLVLLDYQMPFLDGFEMLSTLKKRPKVILISGYLTEPEGAGNYVDKFVTKTALQNPEDLADAIRDLF
jgi:DNA-binding NarL/FixJ family response regulator